MGAICCHGNQNYYPISQITLFYLSLCPMQLHIKFEHDWLMALEIYFFENEIGQMLDHYIEDLT